MALLSWMPRVRSLYSRYFSTMGASSLWALAAFWKRAESETMSGEDRALLSSSYFNSVWSRRSNMGSFLLYGTRSDPGVTLSERPQLPRVEGPLFHSKACVLESQFVAAGAARQSPVRRRAVSPTPW